MSHGADCINCKVNPANLSMVATDGLCDECRRKKPCDRAPYGWKCTRAKDHYGPCAAHRVAIDIEDAINEVGRLRALLRKYGAHSAVCQSSIYFGALGGRVCTCGLQAELNRIDSDGGVEQP